MEYYLDSQKFPAIIGEYGKKIIEDHRDFINSNYLHFGKRFS